MDILFAAGTGTGSSVEGAAPGFTASCAYADAQSVNAVMDKKYRAMDKITVSF